MPAHEAPVVEVVVFRIEVWDDDVCTQNDEAALFLDDLVAE